jgi:protoporphyrinogen oxidase
MVKERLGYIHGGFHRLIEAWKRGIEERGGHIATGADVRSLERSDTGFSIRVNIDGTEEVIRSDAVLNTLPIPLLLQLLSNPPSETRARLSRISYRAVLCLTIGLKRRLMPYYWLNILDEGLPFGGIIEHTNLVPENDYTGEHIVYIFRYLDTSDPWWTMDEARIRHEVLTGLERIFPDLSEEDVIWSALARDEYATPQFLTEYGDHMPRPRTDIEGLFMAGSFQVYPFSRNINNTIQASATAVDDVKAYLRWDGAGQG